MAKFMVVRDPVDGKQKVIAETIGGARTLITINDNANAGEVKSVATWNEFNAAMSVARNHGSLFYIEDAQGADGLNPNEPAFAYIIDGSAYELIRGWEGLTEFIGKIDDKLELTRQDIDINSEDLSLLEQQVAQLRDAVEKIENIWTGTEDIIPDVLTATTKGTFNLAKNDGDKGPFDFTDGKKVFIKVGFDGSEWERIELKVGETAKTVSVGAGSEATTFKISVDTSGIAQITDYDHTHHPGDHGLGFLKLTEVEQSKAVSISNPDDLVRFNEDIIYHTTTTAGEGRLEYEDSDTKLVRTSVLVDAITGVGIDTFTYKTNFDIKDRVDELGTFFGGGFELAQSSVSYSNPTDANKNFQISGNKDDGYKVELVAGKIVITAINNAIISVNGALEASPCTIDDPTTVWGNDGLMKITFSTGNNTLVDGGKFLTFQSLVHPHTLKTYAWQTIRSQVYGPITSVYELHFNPSAPGATDGKVERVELNKA